VNAEAKKVVDDKDALDKATSGLVILQALVECVGDESELVFGGKFEAGITQVTEQGVLAVFQELKALGTDDGAAVCDQFEICFAALRNHASVIGDAPFIEFSTWLDGQWLESDAMFVLQGRVAGFDSKFLRACLPVAV
jgi:hypothetical protein